MQFVANNERLEYLGDAILDYAVVSLLFDSSEPISVARAAPGTSRARVKVTSWDASEGDLTTMKIKFTCNQYLSDVAKKINLHEFIYHHSIALHTAIISIRRAAQVVSRKNDRPRLVSKCKNDEDTGQSSLSSSSSSSSSSSPSSSKKRDISYVDDADSSNITDGDGEGADLRTERNHSLKFLADAFEAIIAAIYIDSDNDIGEIIKLIRLLFPEFYY